MLCPKCNTENKEGIKFCKECGFNLLDLTENCEDVPIQIQNNLSSVGESDGFMQEEQKKDKISKKKKRVFKILLSILLIVVLFFSGNFALYHIGNKFYDEENYKTASKLYKFVIPMPFKMFEEFKDKKQEANIMVLAEKDAAKAIVALLEESKYANVEDIKSISAARGTPTGIVYGTDMIALQQSGAINCTYVVTKKKIEDDEATKNFPRYYNEKFDLHILAVGENDDNKPFSWLASATSDIHSIVYTFFSKSINIENVLDIYNKYQKNENPKVFN